MTGEKRRRAWQRGFNAESLAAWTPRLKGYRILARRLRTPAGEIDIVARR
ncbi:MAG: YraN family protein, partial [Rhodospirillales bacterium]|nr:YraN family protein [Rhodospirillales bacterium]